MRQLQGADGFCSCRFETVNCDSNLRISNERSSAHEKSRS